jgi:glycyl-tRNA synthetase
MQEKLPDDMSKANSNMEQIVSLSKRRGFIYPGSEIYGGLSGTWDYGPLGVMLKNNLKKSWWKRFVDDRNDMFGVDAAIIMNPKVWEASGHVAGFSDPLEDGERFNTMFKTSVGAGEESATSYLRPETAQGIFVNFKNIIDSFHPKLPFGIAQIGKAFRNEIAPRDFIFRAREFEQMEIEYFTKEKDWETLFEYWRGEVWNWLREIGLEAESVKELEVPEDDRAHYSKRTIDFEFDFPFGRRELCGLAYRTDFDLKNHSQASGVDLQYNDEENKEKFIPHCIEPTFGVDRLILAILSASYREDDLGGEKRTYLKLPATLASYKVAVFPLLKNKPDLVKKAFHIYSELKKEIPSITFDDNGNIGKRYRRQDEIGTPHCITVDFDTLEDDTVTLRARNTGKQERVKIEEIVRHLNQE